MMLEIIGLILAGSFIYLGLRVINKARMTQRKRGISLSKGKESNLVLLGEQEVYLLRNITGAVEYREIKRDTKNEVIEV